MAIPYDKDELKTLVEDIADKVSGKSDMDWSEICAKHGNRVNPETLRKAGVGVKLMLEAGV